MNTTVAFVQLPLWQPRTEALSAGPVETALVCADDRGLLRATTLAASEIRQPPS